MSEPISWAYMGEAFGAAAADCYQEWLEDSCKGLDRDTVFAAYVKSFTLNVTMKVGLPVVISAKIEDRRPGKSVEHHYAVERYEDNRKVSRWKRPYSGYRRRRGQHR